MPIPVAPVNEFPPLSTVEPVDVKDVVTVVDRRLVDPDVWLRFPLMERLPSVPTDVRELLVTLVPNPVEDNA